MVEVTANGKTLDLGEKGQDIKYTVQIADIFDIASVSSSYTNSFQIPKSDKNTEAFNMLGIAGDTSRIPYERISASIKEDGFEIVSSGYLDISSTSENYKIAVINGIVELFKSMENKTIGVDLDLSNFNHEKNIETVTESINNDYYKYIVADYGGKKYTDGGINIDYISPSFSVSKLLELIFNTFGWSVDFEGINDFINGLFITYPLATSITSGVVSANLEKPTFVSPYINTAPNVYEIPDFNKAWNIPPSIINEGSVSGGSYICGITSPYTLNLKIKGYALYKGVYLSSSSYVKFNTVIEKNGVALESFLSDPYEIVERQVSVFLESGDRINIKMYVTDQRYGGTSIGAISLREFHVQSIILNIKRVNQGDISLTSAMKSFKITDFIKEIIWRTGVTPMLSKEKKVYFLKIEDRLSFSNAVDWTDRYVARTDESYIKSSYSQRNLFKMKYNNEGQNSNDGVLLVNNKNIDAERTLAQTQLYAPEIGTSEFLDSNGLNPTLASILPMWKAEPKDDGNGEISIEYKPLDNRFYFLRFTQKNGNFKLSSDAVIGSENVSSLLFSNTALTLFDQLVPIRYYQFQKIFDNFRSHDISLNLSSVDIINIDLSKIYYFSQEGSYYMINKISFQKGEVSKAECIKIIPSVPVIPDPNVITLIEKIGGNQGVYTIKVYYDRTYFRTSNLYVFIDGQRYSIPRANTGVITFGYQASETRDYQIQLTESNTNTGYRKSEIETINLVA